MRKPSRMTFFLIAFMMIILFPDLAGFLPVFIIGWLIFRSLTKPPSYTPKQNPYRKRFEKKYKSYNPPPHTDARYREPESYQPKNYRYNAPQTEEQIYQSDENLDNPWKKTSEAQKAQKSTRSQSHPKKEQQKKYKPAPITKQEKQSFIFYFIPILLGALATSVAMQLDYTRLAASLIGLFFTFVPLAILLLIRGKKKKKALSGQELIFEQGHRYVAEIKEIAEQIERNPSIQWEIKEIAYIVKALYKNFEEDPSDIDRARHFIKYNLPDAIKLMSSYARLSARPQVDSQQLQKAEDAIISIRESFEKLEQDLLSNDLMDLEIQSRTIKTVLQNNLHFIKE